MGLENFQLSSIVKWSFFMGVSLNLKKNIAIAGLFLTVFFSTLKPVGIIGGFIAQYMHTNVYARQVDQFMENHQIRINTFAQDHPNIIHAFSLVVATVKFMANPIINFVDRTNEAYINFLIERPFDQAEWWIEDSPTVLRSYIWSGITYPNPVISTSGKTLLDEAIAANKINIVRFLLDYGIVPNIFSSKASDAHLQIVLDKGYPEMARILLAKMRRTQLIIKDRHRRTFLDRAALMYQATAGIIDNPTFKRSYSEDCSWKLYEIFVNAYVEKDIIELVEPEPEKNANPTEAVQRCK